MASLRKNIAEGTFTLPVVSVLATIVGVWANKSEVISWICLPLIALSTLMMLNVNNINVLLRVRSRLVSSMFLLFIMMNATAFTALNAAILLCSMSVAVLVLTMMYYQPNRVGLIFYSALFIGIVSLGWIHALFFIPIFLILLAWPIFGFGSRTISAVLMGLLLPYIVFTFYNIVYGDPEWLTNHFEELSVMPFVFDYADVTLSDILSFSVMTVSGVVGSYYAFRYSYLDKIRVRAVMQVMMVLFLLFGIIVVVFSGYSHIMLPVYGIPTSVLAAHMYAHAHGRLSNWSFILLLVAILVVTIYSINQL